MRHVNQWAIGNVTVHKIDETQFSSRIGAWLLPEVDPDDISDSRHRTPGGGSPRARTRSRSSLRV